MPQHRLLQALYNSNQDSFDHLVVRGGAVALQYIADSALWFGWQSNCVRRCRLEGARWRRR
jgi:hypothetical protein